MSNMAYCRFRNTLSDLRDCFEHIDTPVTSDDEEEMARQRLIELCKNIADRYAEDDEDDEDEEV